jgi:hypothetical protein
MRAMKDWWARIVFAVCILIVLIPAGLEITFVKDFYRGHPLVSYLLIVVLVLSVGWWLRNQSEQRIAKPINGTAKD